MPVAEDYRDREPAPGALGTTRQLVRLIGTAERLGPDALMVLRTGAERLLEGRRRP